MKRVFTAWGKHEGEPPHALSGGEGPPRFTNGEADPNCKILTWRIEANSWEEAMAIYHLRQGWEPYRPGGNLAWRSATIVSELALPQKEYLMPTREDYLQQPLEKRLACLERTPDELATALQGQHDAVLSRRPDAQNWAAKEVVCHLRDIEEQFILRFRTMLAMDEPKFLTLGDMPNHPADGARLHRADPEAR